MKCFGGNVLLCSYATFTCYVIYMTKREKKKMKKQTSFLQPSG